MQNPHKMAFCALAAIWLLAPMALAQNAEFNYNGRVNANGQPFTGTGRFKFALVDQAGTQTYYANDGITLNGQEPTAFVTTQVTNGFFSVNIGDTTIPGMAELDPSIFNSGPVYLRTWFSDGSGFERLSPDRRVVNPGLLGLRSRSEIKLYVNSVSGNDQLSGLTPGRAKKTIQAAWNSLPALIETSATIHIANGTYREAVRVRGKTCIGDSRVTFVGNIANPSLVRVTGANAGAESVAVLSEGFFFNTQGGIILKGISFDRYTNNAIRLEDYSSVRIEDCIVHHTMGPGIYLTIHSNVHMERGEIYSTNGAAPMYLQLNSTAFLIEVYIHDNKNIQGGGADYGISVLFGASLTLKSCRFKNMNKCVDCSYAGIVIASATLPYTIMENSNIGYYLQGNSTAVFPQSYTTFINVITPIDLSYASPVAIF